MESVYRLASVVERAVANHPWACPFLGFCKRPEDTSTSMTWTLNASDQTSCGRDCRLFRRMCICSMQPFVKISIHAATTRTCDCGTALSWRSWRSSSTCTCLSVWVSAILADVSNKHSQSEWLSLSLGSAFALWKSHDILFHFIEKLRRQKGTAFVWSLLRKLMLYSCYPFDWILYILCVAFCEFLEFTIWKISLGDWVTTQSLMRLNN